MNALRSQPTCIKHQKNNSLILMPFSTERVQSSNFRALNSNLVCTNDVFSLLTQSL